MMKMIRTIWIMKWPMTSVNPNNIVVKIKMVVTTKPNTRLRIPTTSKYPTTNSTKAAITMKAAGSNPNVGTWWFATISSDIVGYTHFSTATQHRESPVPKYKNGKPTFSSLGAANKQYTNDGHIKTVIKHIENAMFYGDHDE